MYPQRQRLLPRWVSGTLQPGPLRLDKDQVAKAVFTYSPDSRYDDDPAVRYHFPVIYRSRAEQAVSDLIIYYMPRRAKEASSSARQSYFATARLTKVAPDPKNNGMCYAILEEYIDFVHYVPVQQHGVFFEKGGEARRGVARQGYFTNSIRTIPEREYELICAAGFGSVIGAEAPARAEPAAFEVAEDRAEFERPLVERLVRRPFRDQAFRRLVEDAYLQTCAVTGIRIINGGGDAEVEAAHIRPVDQAGPDTVRNGIALGRTVHWLFDRGLISIGDDYSILTAPRKIPDNVAQLLNPGRRLLLPPDQNRWPSRPFLEFHRQHIFKG
jgi:putative restriction endonuclease